MPGTKVDLDRFLSVVEGDWKGEETVVTGPNVEDRLTATGTFGNRPALAGRGFTSSYSQSVDGETTLDCQTTYVFDDDGGVQMAWVPSSGDAQLFRGRRNDFTVEVAREDENGMIHIIVADYGTADVAEIHSELTNSEMPAMEVFSARYTRAGKRSG